MFKKILKSNLWEKKSYYQKARSASLDTKHPGIVELKKLSKDSKKILDLGCGEGTKLNFLVGKGKKGVGVDISTLAVKLGNRQYPHLNFVKADLEELPFKDNQFDLTYSAFVLEHLDDPVKVINEAIRVTEPKGKLVFIAPNFGAPNRASPSFRGSRIRKFLTGFLSDIKSILRKSKRLGWKKVIPISANGSYEIDWDTTVEPYLPSLINFLGTKGIKIIKSTSLWNEEMPNAKIHQKIFRYLGEVGVYPFTYWGPHLLVVSQKI